MRNNKGFTLAELMTVIAIIAILSTIAIPNYFNWLPKQRLRSAAGDVLFAMQLARSRTVKENASVVLTFDPVNENYTVFLDNGAGANAGNGVQDAGENTVRSGSMPAGINLVSTTFIAPANTIRFDTRGLPVPSGSKGVVNLINSRNETRIIEVNVAGNSRIL